MFNKNTQTMRTITYESKKINLDFSLGCINDVYVKELGGNFDDLINISEHESNPSKMMDITRDMLLSGHIYYLFCNAEDEKAEELLTKLKSSKMIATKWLMSATIPTIVDWLSKDLMPSDMDQPLGEVNTKKKK